MSPLLRRNARRCRITSIRRQRPRARIVRLLAASTRTTSLDRYDITAALRRSGCNQAQLAERLGVTPSLVTAVVSGRRRSPRVRHAICRQLGLPHRVVWDDATSRSQP